MTNKFIQNELCGSSLEKVLKPIIEQISLFAEENVSVDHPKGLSKSRSTILGLIKIVSR